MTDSTNMYMPVAPAGNGYSDGYSGGYPYPPRPRW